ncbi:Fis family transcriptional regulator [Dasania sp. GY-MA-18]|uniref:Fis family transcriptional regulator n=1 Tax=Dasania phycosphaerae TaxID=2950436 RepID=A0A9J6RH15_9GAMM|nr:MULTISPECIES: Fis family transcriptional regulator [Dasania]MCR8921148.1 Fis family transcriptional regulator [Dasania sp. GY-MA-18]MCZ0863576.1 Fis family transcriptional regulator [Dasania phycosphaerae]MCZ0867304.1 Fis family transcriptional regulator [Dasania phycosphaerae]
MARPKSKTQKKLDQAITVALTAVCESLLQQVPGFQWLTHRADYARFPASLIVTCVFDSEEHRLQAEQQGDAANMRRLLQAALLKIGVKLTAPARQLLLDSEQACEQQCAGDWQRRLAQQALKSTASFH